MKKCIKVLFLSFILLLSQVAIAGEKMTVDLAVPNDPLDAQTGKVILTIRNEGDTSVTISKFKVPSWTTGELHGDVFKVVSVYSNSLVNYKGVWDNPGPPTSNNFFVMNPGDSKTVLVDLRSNGYPMYGGDYNVTFVLDLGLFPSAPYPEDQPLPPENDPRVLHSVTSNTITITINPNLINGGSSSNSFDRKVGFLPNLNTLGYSVSDRNENKPNSCNMNQLTLLEKAAQNAFDMANAANHARKAMYPLNQAYDSSVPEAVKYEFFFGPHVAKPFPPDVTNGWSFGADGIAESIIYVQSSSRSMVVECMCEGDYGDAVARVRPTYVQICPRFWQLNDVGYDSKAETFYHELTHYDVNYYNGYTWVYSAKTVDYAYYSFADHDLALRDKSRAVHNADSYGRFAVWACEDRYSTECWSSP